MTKKLPQPLSSAESEKLIKILKSRFEKNMQRHPDFKWDEIQTKILAHADKLWSLNEMEKTGGEPDVVEFEKNTSEIIFYDCSTESPIGRRNICYDREAQESRKKFAPPDSAMNVANNMGIELLTEEQYRQLQQIENFDTKTSSWLKTPAEIRKLGGALYADRRYNQVFIYHNGADSYYKVRGFRGFLKV
jgi:hypothetical protein